MTREEAEQYLYYAMTIGEQLLCCGAEVGRVEEYHTADLPGIWSHPGRWFFLSHPVL